MVSKFDSRQQLETRPITAEENEEETETVMLRRRIAELEREILRVRKIVENDTKKQPEDQQQQLLHEHDNEDEKSPMLDIWSDRFARLDKFANRVSKIIGTSSDEAGDQRSERFARLERFANRYTRDSPDFEKNSRDVPESSYSRSCEVYGELDVECRVVNEEISSDEEVPSTHEEEVLENTYCDAFLDSEASVSVISIENIAEKSGSAMQKNPFRIFSANKTVYKCLGFVQLASEFKGIRKIIPAALLPKLTLPEDSRTEPDDILDIPTLDRTF